MPSGEIASTAALSTLPRALRIEGLVAKKSHSEKTYT
jgi:hypothetical protein